MSDPAAKSLPQACSHESTCALFPLFRDRSALGYWMKTYCRGDHERCARFQSMKRGEPPPATLLPNGKHIG